MTDRLPCPGCKQFHRGPHHKPEDVRSVQINFTLPRWLDRQLRDQVPWGDRSAYIRALIEADLVPSDE